MGSNSAQKHLGVLKGVGTVLLELKLAGLYPLL